MYHQLATRFGRNAHQISGREPLDNEALYRHVPSIFAREAHDSRSDRYVYVPTIDIVEGVRREGWFPFFAVQSVPRDGSRHGHAKHMLRLRRADGIGKPEAAEVIIVNSHDGTSAYQMFAGMLRFVCTNSMIAGERFEEVRVPHKGNIEHDIIEGVYTVAEDFPRLIDASETMKGIQLSEDERRLLGEVSLVARYGEDESPLRPEQIIEPRRRPQPVDHVQRDTGECHSGRVAGPQAQRRRPHPPRPDPCDQRYRPECDAQSRSLDLGRGNAAPQSGLTPITAGPKCRPCGSANSRRSAMADRRRPRVPRSARSQSRSPGRRPARKFR